MPKIPRWLSFAGYVVAFVVLAGALCVLVPLYRSLPDRDGRILLPGLTRESAVTRDRLGLPTISAANRREAATITGFLHAQDRFFQMDLTRRLAAGELAELFGPAALPVDRQHRLHRLREVARQALEKLPEPHRELLEDYAAGVNRGLQELEESPFEYLLLRTRPTAWKPEDCLLVSAAMAFALQDTTGEPERSRAVVRDVFAPAVADFLLSPADDFEAALDGSQIAPPPLPDRLEFAPDSPSAAAVPLALQPAAAAAPTGLDARLFAAVAGQWTTAREELPGSNAFAIAGGRAVHDGAIVANDMHMALAVPAPWYRLRLVWLERDRTKRMLNGVTLPGLPVLIAGTNGSVAWGFTNSYIDTSDVVLVETDPAHPERYRTPEGWRDFAGSEETIAVKGAGPETLRVQSTIWGPVIGRDHRGRTLALKWVMHDPAAYNLQLAGLEDVNTARAALAFAKAAGMPHQNIIVGDRAGNIGWTIAGRIAQRSGFDGRTPVSWADGTAKWDGWLDLARYPQVYNPRSGIVWSANSRMVGGADLALLGDGGYGLGSRASEIRDRLLAFERRAQPADLLQIQLNDRGRYLERWQTLLLATLTPAAVGADAGRAELRQLAETWGGRAVPASAGYRLVREFRLAVTARVEEFVLARCRAVAPDFRAGRLQLERPVFALASRQPAGWLPPGQPGWPQLLLAAADQVIKDAGGPGTLAQHTWGESNRLDMRHPLSRAVPGLRWLLDMPHDPLPGDTNVVRAQGPAFGASLRMVVQPGNEAASLLHMPGGESGHPLSPHYSDSHAAWVRGEPAPLEPDVTEDHLLLVPVGAD